MEPADSGERDMDEATDDFEAEYEEDFEPDAARLDASLVAELRDVSPTEPGIIVGVEISSERDAWSVEASLDELAQLAATAGVRVVGRLAQRLRAPNPSTLIGSGKVEEVKAAAEDLSAEVIIFDRELSPRQQRNLERVFDMKVLDRTALILDVFAGHARTREGMLQVELAQYEYRLPRLTRMWTHLARQAGGRAGGAGGGVGVRGPGETQLEIDRREIGRRIAFLKGHIDKLREQRRQSRSRRSRAGVPVIALVGYTNAGKSTLMNALSDSHIYAADQLFATLDPTTRRVQLPSAGEALMTDTVGFMQRLPTELVAAFRATLEEIADADILLHVLDATHPDVVRQAESVEVVLGDLGLAESPMIVAANKLDRLGADFDPGVLDPIRDLYPDLIEISAQSGQGLDDLRAAIAHEIQQRQVSVLLSIPYAAGDVVNMVHRLGHVETEEYEEAGTRIKARVPRHLLGDVAPYRVDAGFRAGAGTDEEGRESEDGVREGGDDVGVVHEDVHHQDTDGEGSVDEGTDENTDDEVAPIDFV